LLAIPADVDVTNRVVLDSILAVEDNGQGRRLSGSNTSGSVSPFGLGFDLRRPLNDPDGALLVASKQDSGSSGGIGSLQSSGLMTPCS